MDIVRLAISKPVGVAVAVLLLVMFGLIGLGAIPVQLVPTVDRPVITVSTNWTGRSPDEIVDEITREQEDVLKNISNLQSMRSMSNQGSATIELEFTLDTEMSRALQEVSDALRQVPEYPEEVDEPVITSATGGNDQPIAWIILDVEPGSRDLFPDFDISTLQKKLEDEVAPYLERIGGVAEVNVIGGRDREARVYVDMTALAQRDLSADDVATALRRENRNTSAGTIAEAKRDFRIRLTGQFETVEDILSTVITYRDGTPVYVGDVAAAELGHQRQRGFVRSNGARSIAINATRETGANTIEVMEELRARLQDVRENVLPRLHPEVGPHLRLRQVYDETDYIESAISLVTQNLWIGGGIAAIVLLLFLRSFVSTGVIAMAIPISVIGTFLMLLAFGRTLNIISLAGLAFAVGMVVDNAIVVLENINRRLREGEAPMTAAYRGGREVWGAILASTLTTIAVFVPILTIQEEAGQLFRDIALAIVAAVTLSLLLSITVIPAACSRWLSRPEGHGRLRTAWDTLFGIAPALGRLNDRIGRVMLWIMSGWRGWTIRPAIILFLMIASVLGAVLLAPPLDYLPTGNQNLVFGGMSLPGGYSQDQMTSIAERLEARIQPYQDARDDPESLAQLPPIQRFAFGGGPPPPPFDPVPVEHYFIGSFGGGMFVGARSAEPMRVVPVGTLISNTMATIPDARGFAAQRSIFRSGSGGASNAILIEIAGADLDRVRVAAERVRSKAAELYGQRGAQSEPTNFNLPQQEYRVELTRTARELGVRTADLSTTIRALFDGAFVGEFRTAGDAIDIVLLPRGGRLESLAELPAIPVKTPAGPVVPLDTLVEIRRDTAPEQIRRIERLPGVTIEVTPPSDTALEEVMAQIRTDILAPLREQGVIDNSMRIMLEGTAAQLDEVKAALFGAAPIDRDRAAWQRVMQWSAYALAGVGLAGLIFGVARGAARRNAWFIYGGAGAIGLFGAIAAVMLAVAMQPELGTARFVWALAVTYLLMCALFESFVYPLVIMITVPLAVVGGFLGLKIVHDATLSNPYVSTQQLDVLTMLGFIILIGIVVNNAILIVHQSLNFMRGEDGSGLSRDPLEAIAMSVKTRIRPIFMSTLTSVGGMAPLVLFPGAGSEMYRGLGSVVIGGLLVSTIFTLALTPLLLSLTLDMSRGFTALLGRKSELEKLAEREGPASSTALQPA